MSDYNKSIGYWLKHLDRLIEESFDRVLAADDLTRRQWQVLNTLAGGPATRAEIVAALAPFWEDVENEPDTVTEELLHRGWVQRTGDDRVELTASGRANHADLLVRVRASRRRVTEGMSAKQYQDVVEGLARMADNLAQAAG